MNRRTFIKSALIGLALSSGLARASLRVVEPRFNPEPMMLVNALMQSEQIARQVRFAQGDIELKRKRLAEIKIEQAKLHLKMVQSIADNPDRPFRMDVEKGIMW